MEDRPASPYYGGSGRRRLSDPDSSDLSGSALALCLAVLLIVVALMFGGFSMMAGNPEPGATGRAGFQEYNRDGTPGRSYVFFWPWENPNKGRPVSQ